MNENASALEKMFKLKENNTDVKTEIIAGITTFVTMAYILFVNPDILSVAGMDFNAVFLATCLSAAIGTFIMGFYANLPFAQAPGMGLNAFFTFGVVLGLGYTWEQALAAIFISGLLFILLTITGTRTAIVEAIPDSLKHAIGGGIGLFIALIGFKNAGIVVPYEATLVTLGSFQDPKVLLSVIGLVITGILMAKRVKGAILIGIISTMLIGIPLGVTNTAVALDFNFDITPTLFKMDFPGLLNIGEAGIVGALTSVLTVVISFSLVDMFDTIGTLIGTGAKAKMLDEKGRLPNMNKALMADAVATSAGAVLGTSTVTTYVESAAGVAEGGKTGLTAVTTGILFLCAIVLAPFALMVPQQATAPALIIVGVLMMGAVREINFDNFEEALPAFFTIALMPFSFSIANGIAAGFIFYALVKVALGKAKEVHPAIYILAILFILRFTILPH
ncbi:putative MFS transporter, AGZA family, xanthine/uracil permease [Natronincola peptidivorans]|uniref:Putative MFS transporter, AGZA family, xanthine/uracil permease n=1 Tax=Natronincola peptidivorans TaxID=426128 RepID=A0A1I0A138_9FIRM|nr:NCS2 family permease [Natronincola peptidivorans]SES87817.1 putative MFS transporter, AGZA family, xanthine/uracil permease [Natronincola peptidivorans]